MLLPRGVRPLLLVAGVFLVAHCSSPAASEDVASRRGEGSGDAGGSDSAAAAPPKADAAPLEDASADAGIVKAMPKVDLYAFRTSGGASGKCEVSILDGGDDYASFRKKDFATLWPATADGSLEMLAGQFDPDGKADIYFLGRFATNSKKTEIHVFDAAASYAKLVQAVATGFDYIGADRAWTMRVGDFNGDKRPDLYGVLARGTGSGKIEVHVADGNANFTGFLEHTPTALAMVADDTQTPFFALADANKDGKLDLYAVSRTATATEVVVLDGANHFLTKLSQDVTPLPPLAADDKTSVLVGDADGEGHPDLFVISRGGAGSGMTEVTILSGADKFQTVLRRGPTALGNTTGGIGTWTFDLAIP